MDRLPIIGRSRVVRDHGNIFCAPNDLVRSFLTNFPILFFRYLRARVEPISGIVDTEFAEVSTTADLKQIAGKLATAWEQRRLSLAQIKHLGVPGRA
jgi:hypothetical protein